MQVQQENGSSSQSLSKPKNLLNYVINHYSVVFLIITFASFGYKLASSSDRVVEAFLISFLTWNVGLRGLVAFAANWISPFADQIAESYGWPLQSSFQREVAATEGAFGILGILCNWFRGDFWTATILAVSFCWFFSELGGLMKIARRKKDPTYQMNKSLHTGMRLDFIFSFLLLIGLVMWKKGY